MTLTPILCGFPVNFGTASRYSWIPIKLDIPDRPLFAQASYITNFSDLSISLSAASMSIGDIRIVDGDSGIRCDVSSYSYGTETYNALRVITQNLEPFRDTISLADKQQNNVSVFAETSSLQVHVTNFDSLTVVTEEINTTISGLTGIGFSTTENQVIQNSLLCSISANTLFGTASSSPMHVIGNVELANYFPVTSIEVANTVNVNVLNPVSSIEITNQLSSISITNPVTAVELLNQLSAFTVLNPATAIDIVNVLDVSGNITIANPVTAVELLNQLSAFTVLNPATAIDIVNVLDVSGNITIANPVTAVELLNQLSAFTVLNPATAVRILNTTAISGSITVLNPVSSVSITNQLTSITVTNPITSVSVNNSVALKDINSNNVAVTPATSSLNVNVTNYVPVTLASGTANTDAFGRLRVSTPLTLFDSSHRYRDNNLWCTLAAAEGSAIFNANRGLVDMNVSGLSGSSVIRETKKVFSYQAGKALLVMNTFVMAPSASNLRQRVGYFGQDNGIYFQLDGSMISFVERSLINGIPVVEKVVPLSAWNGDRLDGTGPSKLELDITKAQIQWMDIEWLGAGTVRIGFVINGQFIVCHSFHHANLIDSTYITTASLPLRYEITNKDSIDGPRTLKQICSTVISEGGYELRGLQQAISIPINSPATFALAGVHYPIISIRLKTTPDRMDAIVILTALSLLGKGNGINYNWQIIASGTTSGGGWISAGTDSSVEYNITGTGFNGGRVLASGFLNSSNQGSPNLDILKEAVFKFQLERNNLTKTPYEISLIVAADTVNGSGVFASMNWEEISR